MRLSIHRDAGSRRPATELPDAKGGVLIRVLCQFHYGGDVGEIGYVVYVAHGAEAVDGVESF
jgi:hypothetical protein